MQLQHSTAVSNMLLESDKSAAVLRSERLKMRESKREHTASVHFRSSNFEHELPLLPVSQQRCYCWCNFTCCKTEEEKQQCWNNNNSNKIQALRWKSALRDIDLDHHHSCCSCCCSLCSCCRCIFVIGFGCCLFCIGELPSGDLLENESSAAAVYYNCNIITRILWAETVYLFFCLWI